MEQQINNNIQLDDDEEWIILNEVITSPFYTGNFNGNDELEAVSVSEFLLNSPQSLSPSQSPKKNNKQTQLNINQDSISLEHQQEEEPTPIENDNSKPYESLILTPEFLISLNLFTNNMNWLSKEVAIKCVQSSQITTNKIISISQLIKNQCKQIANITTAKSYMNYSLEI